MWDQRGGVAVETSGKQKKLSCLSSVIMTVFSARQAPCQSSAHDHQHHKKDIYTHTAWTVSLYMCVLWFGNMTWMCVCVCNETVSDFIVLSFFHSTTTEQTMQWLSVERKHSITYTKLTSTVFEGNITSNSLLIVIHIYMSLGLLFQCILCCFHYKNVLTTMQCANINPSPLFLTSLTLNPS